MAVVWGVWGVTAREKRVGRGPTDTFGIIIDDFLGRRDASLEACVCVCVCVCERERERERECVCVCVCTLWEHRAVWLVG